MNKLLIICAASNTSDGELSHIALDRLLTALQFLKNNPSFNILCTGGFGEAFNTSDYAHAQLMQNFLLEHGIAHESFVEFVLGENLLEDIQLTRRVLSRYSPEAVVVITSDYQMERVRLSFELYCSYPNMIFIEAKSSIFEDELERLKRQESQGVNRLRMMLRASQ
ncbi:YdcF family protein [Flectobacillus sp. BAB-3569]|uniref:YdcF family protein n=1 Tax=Flectobacillus sp. BAB-3569 TaxID=1509483 RepID=UPI000BA3B958|nr:YdcF family protein [Flectobacillus sp. BAB-3569]PAC26348.1 hypothetical protein BWI92_26110 [Flectobacillus sp. BAB-3569]